MAPQETLEGSRVTGKGDPSPKVSSPTPSVVDQGNKCLTRSTHASVAPCPSGPGSSDSTVQWGSSQGSSQSQSSRLAPRAEAIKEQGFFAQWRYELRLLKDVQPDK